MVRWLQCAEGNEKLLDLSRGLVVRVGCDASNITTALSEEDQRTVWKLLKLCIVTKRSGQSNCFLMFTFMYLYIFAVPN